ncbi:MULTISPECIES: RNA polymerase sigma factor [Sporosarcina]|uniref:RNA polymerase sigma factor n=1 Tax=Sporosarcina TaxID=1569 RepID=UPI00129B32A2|nr:MULTISPECIES: sigma-70 family RNA polymerase sigma factor [Sporosarcina]GKV67368.1 RNA polymerase subunit sigma [Sporosarcina sp. NCCP-2331]GLB57724.1 RNA polymerase subunit sigma [Sporosarcina sp. NCCP-2378]
MEDLSEVYTSYANEIKLFLLCLTSHADLAEELTQETFYQAVKSIERYDGECKMSVWLCQIAKHSYYDHLKREKYRNYSSLEHLAQTGIELPSNEDLPDIAVIKQDTQQKVQEEIQRLKEPQREIFLLRTKLELSFKEIGMIFEKNENWARVTYYRAKCTLAERLDKNEM